MSESSKKLESGSTNITASGTPQRLVTSDLWVDWVLVFGKYGNSGICYLGPSAAKCTAALGFNLTTSHGTSWEWRALNTQDRLNLAELYVDAANTNDDVIYFYTVRAAASIS